MQIAIGSTVLGSGTRAEPVRIISSVGAGNIEVTPLIDAASPALYDRGNRVFRDVIEVDYTYADYAAALLGIPARRKAALAATGNLIYGTGESSVTVGPALVEQAELVEFIGSGITMRYTIVATESYS